MARFLFNSSHGKEHAERATLPFVAANVAAQAGQQAAVVLTVDSVWLATEGGADGVRAEGLPVLTELIAEFVDAGGELWACSACTKPRGITEDHMIKGAKIVGAAKVVEELAGGAQAVSFA